MIAEAGLLAAFFGGYLLGIISTGKKRKTKIITNFSDLKTRRQ